MENKSELPDEIVMQYIDRRRTDLSSLRNAVSTLSSAEFSRIGHQLKGNAASYGFDELAPLARELEEVGKTKNWLQAETLIKRFEDWLSQFDDKK